MRQLILLIFFLLSQLNGCDNYKCDGNFYRNFSRCTDDIKDLRDFEDVLVYFEVEKKKSKLEITKFSKEVPESIRIALLDAVKCMDAGFFKPKDKFKVVYMRLHLDQLDEEGYKESLAEKIKKDNDIKGKTCLIWTAYGSPVY